MYEKLKKVWNWIKDHAVAVGIAVLSIITLGKYTADRIDDKRRIDNDSNQREREAEIINQRLERTTQLESEFIDRCEDSITECEEHIESARDTVGRIEQSTITAEQAIEELRRRIEQGEFKE